MLNDRKMKTDESVTPIVEFKNITKAFPGVKALDDVSFSIMPGEVHCVLGENGAGKSTLMKILTGVYHLDSGTILIEGNEVHIENILKSRELGIGTVFQENSLIQDLTIAENVFLTREIKNKLGFVNWKRMYSECRGWCENLGVTLDPQIRVKDLTVAQQQVVEIIKVFSQKPKIVILDEPTSSLSDNEIDNLFNIINRMRKQGVTFIYISHRLEELKQIGNSGSILRDGKYIAYIDNVDVMKIDELVTFIVGRKLDQQYPVRKHNIGAEVLKVKNLNVQNLIFDVGFSLHKGEVLGFSGLMGSGRTTTAKAIFGAQRHAQGKIILNGKELNNTSPNKAVSNGIGLLPENRKEEGLVLNQSVAWNTTFAALKKYRNGLFINHKSEKADVNKYIDDLHIKTPSMDRTVKYLSGGNQQKVVFAKWLCADTDVFIFDEPTRGIDVGAKSEIYSIINQLAANGKAVIVISSELPELLGITDRIIVFYEGRAVADMKNKDLTQEDVMYYGLGGYKIG